MNFGNKISRYISYVLEKPIPTTLSLPTLYTGESYLVKIVEKTGFHNFDSLLLISPGYDFFFRFQRGNLTPKVFASLKRRKARKEKASNSGNESVVRKIHHVQKLNP